MAGPCGIYLCSPFALHVFLPIYCLRNHPSQRAAVYSNAYSHYLTKRTRSSRKLFGYCIAKVHRSRSSKRHRACLHRKLPLVLAYPTLAAPLTLLGRHTASLPHFGVRLCQRPKTSFPPPNVLGGLSLFISDTFYRVATRKQCDKPETGERAEGADRPPLPTRIYAVAQLQEPHRAPPSPQLSLCLLPPLSATLLDFALNTPAH